MKNIQLSQTILNAWKQEYQLLHDILCTEQLALEKRNFEQLIQVITEKDQAVIKINRQQIPPLVDHHGIQVTSMRTFKAFCNSHSDLKKSWNDLIELIEKCHLKNEINARLISLLNASTRRTFNLIKGFDPDNNIYNAHGNRASVKHFSSSISA